MRYAGLVVVVLIVGLSVCPLLAFGQGAPSGAIECPSKQGVPEYLSPGDWSSIREVHDANRHALRREADGYRARNPRQRWTTHFDGRAFSVQPDGGGWTWGLRLRGYGFADNEDLLRDVPRVVADGSRLAYEWHDGLSEWFVNDRRGLEHGFTVHRRPAGGGHEEPLVFRFAIGGSLRADVVSDGRTVQFLNDGGSAVLVYAGLVVFDADGRHLEAGFETIAEGLRLTIDERNARYPLTIDPVAQQVTYLKASNTDQSDHFGVSVAISGDTILIGAPGEDSNATGVNGDDSDNSMPSSGAAYVFVRNGATWIQQAYLKASTNAGAADGFGASVALSGDTAVIGVPGDASDATGVNGVGSGSLVIGAGAAYVFVRNGTTWIQEAYLKASNTGAGDAFGHAVSVSGNVVVVGSLFEDSHSTGVNGDQGNDLAPNSGAAYVFVRSGTIWTQEAYLKASNTGTSDQFGYSVAASADTVVIGAVAEDSHATSVNGNGSDNTATDAGAAYVFLRVGTTWNQQAYLKASNTDPNDLFGLSVAISGDTVIVGATGEDSNAIGVNGDQTNNSRSRAGAAYVFVRSGGIWSQEAYFKASNTDDEDRFGWSVSVSGDTVVVGAWGEDSIATGVDGDGSNNVSLDSGAAYVFVRHGGTWFQDAYLKASNTGPFDAFGWSVAVSDGTVIAGAWREASNATGINGDGSNNSANFSGAAYVYETHGTWTDIGFALSGGMGVPLWQGRGSLRSGSANLATLQNVCSFATAVLLVSVTSTPASFAGGTLAAFPYLSPPFFYQADSAGQIAVPFVMPPGVPSGTEFWTQWVIVDDSAMFGWALSNALHIVTP